ncbi:MAG: tRNA (adenosine(37)-N6)-threonylcarbamoyltransferase complex dimerization subunit type 1 TsaB [Sphingobacteriales bacterium]|nr:MAG: tRNA (adenosine(37)-N6)-threonylcarbamoyltransferase complex dimerization subunit type 1 TsaB [Sphingobacteriales bacterium]TAF79657.1 MAG: tRNA (adenosine(37)-N6)-threonylcarbamoyltransferase complex dimerization subunit type 1 TsaB [Sphingobacteriales bacterium]
MAIILLIETATQCCSVAIAQDGALLYKKELNEQNVHAGLITLFIDEVINNSIADYAKIDAVAVSRGPGSYTGLRIGVSTAKGLCYALDKPLIAVDTLQAMAYGFKAQYKIEDDKIRLCPMIDARRMEVYCALYDVKGILVLPTEAKIIDEYSFSNKLNEHKIYFFGDGASKCGNALSAQSNAIIVDNFINSAEDMCALAYQKFIANQFENVAYFEPFYLKEFIVLSKS